MEARVKSDYRFGEVTAFGGSSYIKTEWRPVPGGCEAEAEKHPFLDVRLTETISVEIPEPQIPAVEVVEGPSAEAEAERAAVARTVKKGGRK